MEKYYLKENNTAFLLIDIQERLFPVIKGKNKLLKPVKIMAKTAEVFDLPIYVTEQYPKGLGETLPEIKSWLKGNRTHYFEKTMFNAFIPEVEEQLKKENIQNIIVSGIETHICVFQTVRDLIKHGYKVYLLEDAVGSREKKYKSNALEQFIQMGAVVTNSETLAYDLLKDSKHPNFKVIASILKEV